MKATCLSCKTLPNKSMPIDFFKWWTAAWKPTCKSTATSRLSLFSKPCSTRSARQIKQLAQGQKSADVKRFSHGYPHRAISGNWPPVAKLPGKTACFGLLAHLVARRVWGQKPDFPSPFRPGRQLAERQKDAHVQHSLIAPPPSG